MNQTLSSKEVEAIDKKDAMKDNAHKSSRNYMMITDHFSEMKCKGSGDCDGPRVHGSTREDQNGTRETYIVSSGYRCPEYNDQVSSSGLTGPHTTGRAVDVVCSGDALKIMELAIKHGMTGIGVSQKVITVKDSYILIC